VHREEVGFSSKHQEQLTDGNLTSQLPGHHLENTNIESGDEDACVPPPDGETATGTTNTTPLATSITSNATILDKQDPLVSLALAIDAPVTAHRFPLMKLPLAIRVRIYEHLVVVPALICVRQNHTAFHKEKLAFLYAEPRELRPGIAFALTQLIVDGHKSRFSQLAAANGNILRVSKQVYAEAKPIMYSKNNFEIVKPTYEMAPPADFSVRLFPVGYQRLVTKLNIRIRSFYDLSWLLGGGHNVIKNYYRGLSTLTLILEMDSASKSYGKTWSRNGGEDWPVYIQRLHGLVAKDLSARLQSKQVKRVPAWINLRVLFSSEAYDEHLAIVDDGTVTLQDGVDGQFKRAELKKALVEVWALLKKSSPAAAPIVVKQ
jgi:hypothetical protein